MKVIDSDCASERVTRHNLQEKIKHPFPARGQTDIHLHGQLLGGNFISCGDKPGGIEPGNLVMVRDLNYFNAMKDILNELRGQTLHTLVNDKVRAKWQEIVEQLADKIQFEQKISPDKAMEQAKIQLLQQITEIELSINSVQSIEELELAFQQNAALFGLVQTKINERNDKLEKNNKEEDKVLTWCIKLDFKDSRSQLQHVGPGRRRAEQTNTSKKKGQKVKLKAEKQARKKGLPEDVVKAKGERAYRKAVRQHAFIHNLGRWFVGNKLEQCIDATLEKVATRHAQDAGMDVQTIHTIEGRWDNDQTTPKTLVAIVWEKKFKTFSDLVNDGYEFSGGPNLSDSNYLTKNGHSQSHKIDGLGQQLALALRHGDRDMIGKVGQNKGIIDNGNKKSFFGIDFGHAFKNKTLLDSLQDDFTFLQPSDNDRKNLVNYAMFYDTPASDRMQGIHIIAKQHGLPVPEEIKKSYPEVWQNKAIQPGGHTKAFNEEISSINEKINTIHAEIQQLKQDKHGANPLKKIKIQHDINKHKAKIKNYKKMMKKIDKTKNIALDNDFKIMRVFHDKLNQTKEEITLTDHLEKLISPNVSNTSANGQVTLNHLRVPREDRIPVRFEMDARTHRPQVTNGQYTLTIGEGFDHQKIDAFIEQHQIQGMALDMEKGQIKVDTQALPGILQQLTENNILAFKEGPDASLSQKDRLLNNTKRSMSFGQSATAVPKMPATESEPEPKPSGPRNRGITI